MVNRIITENLSEEFNNARRFDQQRETLMHRKKEQKRAVERFYKTAGVYGGGEGYHAPNVLGIAPEYHVPQLENSSLELPRYRQQIISWCDFYYETNELIGTAVDIHATLSVADFAIQCKDRARQQDYEDLLETLDYTELLYEIAQEFFRVGNVFPMGDWDDSNGTWSEFSLVPMLNIELKRMFAKRDPKIYLMPNEALKAMASDPDLESDMKGFPEDVQNHLRQGLPVLLNPNRVSHISTKSIAGTMWGVPPIYRCFKTLIYADKLYRAQEAIADGHITPLRIISLVTPDGMPVSPEEASNFRDQLVEAQFDPNYIILTSGTAKDSYIGSGGKILPTSSENDNIERRITSGLKINKALLHGEGPTYANAQVYQTTMNTYYLHFRNRLKNWLVRKVFTPVAEANGWYQKSNTELATNLSDEDKKSRLILPEIYWQGLGNIDAQTTTMLKDLWMGKKISTRTYMQIVLPNIDPEEEEIQVLREAEEAIALKQVAPNIQQQLDKPHNVDDKSSGEGDDDDEESSSKPSTRPKDSPMKVVKSRKEFFDNIETEEKRQAILSWLNTSREKDGSK